MRSLLLAAVLIATPLLLAAALPTQDPAPTPAPEPTQEELVALRIQILEKEVAEIRGWIQAQAAQAASLSAACDRSEAEGFLAGINPRSREILLSAIRAHAASFQVAVPGAPPAEEEATPESGGEGVRRGR